MNLFLRDSIEKNQEFLNNHGNTPPGFVNNPGDHPSGGQVPTGATSAIPSSNLQEFNPPLDQQHWQPPRPNLSLFYDWPATEPQPQAWNEEHEAAELAATLPERDPGFPSPPFWGAGGFQPPPEEPGASPEEVQLIVEENTAAHEAEEMRKAIAGGWVLDKPFKEADTSWMTVENGDVEGMFAEEVREKFFIGNDEFLSPYASHWVETYQTENAPVNDTSDTALALHVDQEVEMAEIDESTIQLDEATHAAQDNENSGFSAIGYVREGPNMLPVETWRDMASNRATESATESTSDTMGASSIGFKARNASTSGSQFIPGSSTELTGSERGSVSSVPVANGTF